MFYKHLKHRLLPVRSITLRPVVDGMNLTLADAIKMYRRDKSFNLPAASDDSFDFVGDDYDYGRSVVPEHQSKLEAAIRMREHISEFQHVKPQQVDSVAEQPSTNVEAPHDSSLSNSAE